MKRYYVLIGNFGSGKTEISINLAMKAAKTESAVLVDLDIVNPYFRSAERRKELNKAGISLLHPVFAMSSVDIPALPPDIYSVFVDSHTTVIFDVGGDPAGATALGQYKANFSKIPKEALQVLFVINPRRPLSSTPELVLDMLHRIKFRSRLEITGLINNSNLAAESSVEELLDGYKMLKAVSLETGIPVAFTTGLKQPLEGFLKIALETGLDSRYIGTPMEIEIFMHRDWDRFTEFGI